MALVRLFAAARRRRGLRGTIVRRLLLAFLLVLLPLLLLTLQSCCPLLGRFGLRSGQSGGAIAGQQSTKANDHQKMDNGTA
jgi:hypothetical protein